VSRSINTYLTPSEPLADTFRLPAFAVIRNALAVQERLTKPPASGSELSLPNPSRHVAVLDSGEISGCIHPVPSPPMLSSPSLKRFDPPDIPANLFPAAVISELAYRSLALQPVDLFALLTDRTQLSPCLRGLLLPGFRRGGCPPRRWISLLCQLDNLHRPDFHRLD
jgi:hypothetical protein